MKLSTNFGINSSGRLISLTLDLEIKGVKMKPSSVVKKEKELTEKDVLLIWRP